MLNSGIKNIIPTAFIMMTSGDYQPQHMRSWSVEGSVADANHLANHIARTASVSISPDLIAQAAPGLVQVGTMSHGQIGIAEGWGTRRGVFILRFNVEYEIGTIVEWIVQGYTDQPGFTERHIDENMVFYINNVFSMNRTTVSYNGIHTQRATLLSDYQMMTGFTGGTVGAPAGNLLMRPQDIFSSISTADLGRTVMVTDATLLANTGVQTSRQKNNVATDMLSNTLNAWHAAASETDAFIGQSGAVADLAYAKQLEQSADQDFFLNRLSEHNRSGVMTSSFTGRMLMKAMQGIMAVYQPITGNGASVKWSSAGQSMPYGVQNLESQIAVQIQAMVPSLMVTSLLSGVSFQVTNAAAGGEMQWSRNYCSAFVPEMGEQQWADFRRRFEREIMPFFTRLQGMVFWVSISCSFYQEIKINIKMQEEIELIAPAFCNALWSPVQTSSAQHVTAFATEVELVANTVNEALMESQMRRAKAGNHATEHMQPARQNEIFSMPRQALQPRVDIPAAPPVRSAGSMTAHLSGGTSAPVAPAGAGSMTAGLSGFAPAPAAAKPASGSMTDGLRR